MKPSLIILAGGKSSRMGIDKALLKFNNKTFVQILYDNLKGICSDVIISSNNPKVIISGAVTIADDIKGIGPMGGLYTCLKHSNTEYNIVVCVDTPFVSKEIIEIILSKSDNFDINILKSLDRINPLIGIYHKSVIGLLASEIETGHYKMLRFIEKSRFQIIDFEDKYSESLININSPEDFKAALKYKLP